MRTLFAAAFFIVATSASGAPCVNCSGDGLLEGQIVSVPCPLCEGQGKAETVLTSASLPADQQPTPMTGVAKGLAALNPKPDEVLVDFGCGRDARWLIQAVSFYSVRKAIGVEIDPEVAESARRHVAEAGLSDRIEIITGDATQVNVQADVGVAYLWPDTLAKLKPKIEKLKRFVAFGHAVPGLTMQRRGDVFVWARPAPVVVQSTPVVMQEPVTVMNFRPATAVYGVRRYSGGPPYPNCSCSMCDRLRGQLGWR